MRSIKDITELMTDAREEEQAGHWDAAARLYQRIVDKDPANLDAVRRLLMVYRKTKEYRKELSVIDAALGVISQRDKNAQNEWLAAHPEAARLGKAMLKSLGGEKVTAYGADSFVEQLRRRKELVERKISGVKRQRAEKRQSSVPIDKTDAAGGKKATKSKVNEIRQKERAADLKRRASQQKEREAESRKAEKAKKQVAAEQKRKETEAKNAERQAALEQRRQAVPSLFVISLHYLVPLERIDAAMATHVAFLGKYFAEGVFLVSGRQVPRTGGVILARAKDHKAVDRIMKQDPFVKGKLAKADIVEFKASMIGKGLQGMVKEK